VKEEKGVTENRKTGKGIGKEGKSSEKGKKENDIKRIIRRKGGGINLNMGGGKSILRVYG
jgi:hypothetical protein